MSTISQGPTTIAIDVDSLPAAPALAYGEEWQKTKTGVDLLSMTFPSTSLKAGVKVIYGSPKPERGRPVIELSNVPTLDKVLPTNVIDKARANLNKALERAQHSAGSGGSPPWGVQIANFGYVSLAAILFLPNISVVKEFVERLRRVLGWVDHEVAKHDVAFALWLKNLLLNQQGVMRHHFTPTTDPEVNIRSIFYIIKENFVDDETVRIVMATFRDHYGADGRYLFIAPLELEAWRLSLKRGEEPYFPWNWQEKKVHCGRVEKAFSIVLLPEHWGAICIDFSKHRISFGDSLNYKVPQDAMAAIWRWLHCLGQDISLWDQNISKFDVPQQPLTSGSCAINAANTIERTINPGVERWTHPRSPYHRIRILKLLTGYSKVSLGAGLWLLKAMTNTFSSSMQLEDLLPNVIDCDVEQAHINVGVNASANHKTELELERDACEIKPEVLFDDWEMAQLELEEESLDNVISPLSGIHDVESSVITEPWRPEVGTMFDSLDNAELQIKDWARNDGFEVKRGYMKSCAENLGMYLVFEIVAGIVCIANIPWYQTVRFDCAYGRVHKEKKVLDPSKHRNASSKHINCPFHINVRSPKKIAPSWYITTIIENHNHELHPGAASFGRDMLKLNSEMVAMIQTYSKANIELGKVLTMLKKEWPEHHFVHRQVSNIILKTKHARELPDVPQVVQLLGLLHDHQQEDSRWFIRKDIDPSSGHLRRLFWMNPVQRELYLRYRDVILNDSTAQTNRFNKPLNIFIVVYADGKSRMVGCALISGETTDDYEWILRSLLEAGEGLAPAVIVVDEDPAMEAACAIVIPEAAMINCI